jgi:hypothetical protein
MAALLSNGTSNGSLNGYIADGRVEWYDLTDDGASWVVLVRGLCRTRPAVKAPASPRGPEVRPKEEPIADSEGGEVSRKESASSGFKDGGRSSRSGIEREVESPPAPVNTNPNPDHNPNSNPTL